MTRAERATEAVRLRAEGLTAREIASRLGVSRSYASELYADPEGAKIQARRERYSGRCVVCGARTTGCNGRAKAPRYCSEHAAENPEWLARSTNWPPEVIVDCIRLWARLYGQPPAIADWAPSLARERNEHWRAARFERDERWPWFTTVVYHFGSWNAAIAAAGFEPRKRGGFSENHQSYLRAKAAA